MLWLLTCRLNLYSRFSFFQAEDGIRDLTVTGVQTCALPISLILDERFISQYEVARRELAAIVLDQLKHGGEVMRDILDAVAAVEAMRHVIRHHRHAHIQWMAHHADDLRLRKCHLQKGKINFVERHLVGEERLAALRKPVLLSAREIVVAKQGRGVAVIGRPALPEISRQRCRPREQVLGELAQLAKEGELAAGQHCRVAAENLFYQSRARARNAHDEDRLRHIAARLGSGQKLDVLPREEPRELSEEPGDRV